MALPLKRLTFCLSLTPVTLVATMVVAATTVMPTPTFANPIEIELTGLLGDHPQIRASEKSLQSSRQGVNSALSGLYPTVSVTGDAGYESIDSPATRTENAPGAEDYGRSRNTATLSVTQNLFSGYATASAVRTARLNRELAQISYEGTRQNTIFEGIQVYIDVLRQRRLIELARENEATIQRQLNLEDERVQRGSGVAVDVLQAKSRLQIAKERRVNFEGALEDAISRYTQVFGHPPDIESMLDPEPPIEQIPSELSKSMDIAVVENPAVGNSGTTVEVARERRRTVRAELFPTVDLEGTYNYEKHLNGALGTRRDYSLVVSSTWELFSGFSTRASMAQAAYDYHASKDQHEYTVRKVVEQSKLAWQSLLTSRERLELLENAVNIASEVFESRKKLREAGKETVINVLDAENEVNNAQINYTSAFYDERLAVYQLLLAMGRLDSKNLSLGF
ncbi:MAG: TolC family outer membrane protein [Rhodospirillales bacterium]